MREPTLGHFLGRTRPRRTRHGPARDRLRPAVWHRLRIAHRARERRSALRLRVTGLDAEQREERIAEVLGEVGSTDRRPHRARALRRTAPAARARPRDSQRAAPAALRRSHQRPDPKAEDEIARLMHQLAHRDERIVLSVTHSLRLRALRQRARALPGLRRLPRPGGFSSLLHVRNPRTSFPPSPNARPTRGTARG